MLSESRWCRVCSEETHQHPVPQDREVQATPEMTLRGYSFHDWVMQVWVCINCLTANSEFYATKPFPQNLRLLFRSRRKREGE